MFSFLGKAIGSVIGVAGKLVGIGAGAKTNPAATVNWQNQINAQNKLIAEMKSEAIVKASKSTMTLLVVGAIAVVIVVFVLLKK